MARIITKELALKITKKLGGTKVKVKGAAHDLIEIWRDGQLISQFGLRHGSSKDQGHDHIPDDLHVGPTFAKLLGQCPKSHEDWLEVLREKGIIESPDEAEESTSE